MTATPSRPRRKLKPGAVARCRILRYLVEEVQATQESGADKAEVQPPQLTMDQCGGEHDALQNQARQKLGDSRRVEQLHEAQDQLRQLQAQSQVLLGLDEPFREALNGSVDLLGVGGLKQGRDGKGHPCRRLTNTESLGEPHGNDRSWDPIFESLRGVWHRRTPLWNWWWEPSALAASEEQPLAPLEPGDSRRAAADGLQPCHPLHGGHRTSSIWIFAPCTASGLF